MGTFINETIVVLGRSDKFDEVYSRAQSLFTNSDEEFGRVGSLVSEVVETLRNNFRTFFIAPDGSKLGWDTYEEYSKRRQEFCEWMNEFGDVKYVFVKFGECDHAIVRSR
jgi:hypothetical protein